MRKILVTGLLLCGCALSENTGVNDQDSSKALENPLEQYEKCMGYSDKSIVYTKEKPGRYIVVISEPSERQSYLNKKEHNIVYRIGLLQCDTGNTIKECQDQMWLHYVSIGSPVKLTVGSIKIFTNDDLIYDDITGKPFVKTTKDGRFESYTNYCYINRENISKTYCSNSISNSEWHNECKVHLN